MLNLYFLSNELLFCSFIFSNRYSLKHIKVWEFLKLMLLLFISIIPFLANFEMVFFVNSDHTLFFIENNSRMRTSIVMVYVKIDRNRGGRELYDFSFLPASKNDYAF